LVSWGWKLYLSIEKGIINMCGIIGGVFMQHPNSVLEQDLPNMRKIFSDMLVKAEKRGGQATGILLVNNEKPAPKIYVLKAPLPAREFIKTDAYKRVMGKLNKDTYSVVGHTRAATRGSAYNNKNNHPHLCGDIVGVHNGGIRNDQDIWSKFKKMEAQGECDSEALFALINLKYNSSEASIEEAIDAAMSECKGWVASALIHLNKPKNVYVFRDSAAPMEIGWWERERVAFFASEKNFILDAITSNFGMGQKVELQSLDPYSIARFEAGNSNSWPANLDLTVTKFGSEENKIIAEVGGGNSRVLEKLSINNECWNIDKFEGVGNGPKGIKANNKVKIVKSYPESLKINKDGICYDTSDEEDSSSEESDIEDEEILREEHDLNINMV